MSYRVEKLDWDLLSWVVEEAGPKMLTEEVGKPELYNKEHLYTLTIRAIEDGTGLIGFKDDVPIGVLAALQLPHFLNPNLSTLVEIVWYVLPEHREGRIGLMLLKAYKEMAEGMDLASLSVLPTTPIKLSTLEKYGFTLREYSMILERN